MPLSEFPPDHVGRNGLGEEPTRSSYEGNHSRKELNIGAYNGLPKTPSSIQSMLKNTTETGDVGLFSIKPARVPSIIYRTSKSPGTSQSVPIKKRHLAGHLHEHRGGNQLSRHPSSVNAPVGATSCRNHNQRSYRDARRGTTGNEEDERSYSMTQSSITRQSFSHRPSPTGLQFHDQDFRGMRPRSPFAYPTRLKRPGYRPSSPAFSDYHSIGLGTYMGPSRAASFRTSSPLSIYTPQRAPSTWQQNFNRSEPMLRYYTSIPRHENYAETLPPLAPAPLSRLPNGLTPARSSTPMQLSDVSASYHPSLSPSPVFYDYTESFDEDHHHSVTISSFSLADQVIPEDTSKVYYELAGSTPSLNIAELPADEIFPSTLPKTHAQDLPEEPLSTKLNRKAVPRPRQLEQHTRYPNGIDVSVIEQDPQMVAQGKGRETEKTAAHIYHLECQASVKIQEADLAPIETRRLGNRPGSQQHQGFSASSASVKSISLSSSLSEQMYSSQSSSQKDRQKPIPELSGPSDPVYPSPAGLEIPLGQPNNSRTISRNIQSHADYVSCDTSFEGKSDPTEHTEIYAPTPERAASSLSNRNRFSRILCLDEDLEDVDKLTAKTTVEAGSHDQGYTEYGRAAGSSLVNYPFSQDNRHLLDTSPGGAEVGRSNITEAGPESTRGAPEISNDSLRLPPMRIPRRSSSRSLLTSVSGYTVEPTIPPRRSSHMRKPGYHLFEKASGSFPGLSVVAEDLNRSAAPGQETIPKSAKFRHTTKEPPAITENLNEGRSFSPVELLKSPNVSRTTKGPPSLSREPTLITYSPPIDPVPSALPSTFTPLFGHLKEEISNANVGSSAVAESKQSIEVSSNPAELPVVASRRQSIDVSATEAEPNTTSCPEQSFHIQGDQGKPTGASLSKQGRNMQADLGEPTSMSHANQHDNTPAAQHDSGAGSATDQSLVMPATLPEPKRVAYSAISSSILSESDDEEQAPISKYKLKMRANRDSPPSLQPWNLDASYPWTGQSPKLEVTMPRKSVDSPEQFSSLKPRFKLKAHQSSPFTTGTTKTTKLRPSTESSMQANINVTNDLFRGSAFGRQPRPSQENSSQSAHLQTRFKESFEQPSTNFAISPTITLVPPSPGLNLEARSFFSDDSSQSRNKGSLRKRLSQLRAMTSRNTMSEEGRSFDRGILRSRASGRISKQSTRTAEGVSHSKSVRSKLAEKVKEWLLRGGEKVRGLLWRSRSASERSDLDRGG